MAAEVSIAIKAPVAKVWEHLTRPELVKKYFFGTEIETNWEPGSPIYWRGTWEGKTYEDKGKVLEFRPYFHLSYLYWSSFSGQPDREENYQAIAYYLRSEEGGTVLTVRQACEESKREHCEKNWSMVLAGLKKQVE